MLIRRTDTSSFPFLNSEVQCTVYLSGCKEIQRSCRLQNKVLHTEQHYPRPPKALLRVSWSLVCPIWNIEFVFVYTGATRNQHDKLYMVCLYDRLLFELICLYNTDTIYILAFHKSIQILIVINIYLVYRPKI